MNFFRKKKKIESVVDPNITLFHQLNLAIQASKHISSITTPQLLGKVITLGRVEINCHHKTEYSSRSYKIKINGILIGSCSITSFFNSKNSNYPYDCVLEQGPWIKLMEDSIEKIIEINNVERLKIKEDRKNDLLKLTEELSM